MAKETISREWTSKYNPFNSDKLLAQLPRWRKIKDWKEGNGELPAPTTVSVDPANVCDLKCLGCNADFLMQRNHNMLSRDTLMEIADFLPTWGTAPYDVKGVCCFHGDTKVKLIDGTNKTFKQLKQIWDKKQKPFEVYSRDEKGNIVPGIATSPRITREITELIEITLDNGQKIKCTLDHQFLLKDGNLKEAQHITKDDSLMPLHYSINQFGHEYIKDTTYRGTTHKLFAKYYDIDSDKNSVVHHVNFNKLDNTKENLQLLSLPKHLSIHARLPKRIKKSKKLIEKVNASEEGKKKEFECFNHKIIKKRIIKLRKPVPVYCLTVEKFHNFALTAGVFVKNCGGGGESLLNPYTGEFIQRLKSNGVKAGIVTNGTMIHKHIKDLRDCEWVGVSVDAGTQQTYEKVKGADKFNRVISNIEGLVKSAEYNNSPLNSPGRGHGVSYKYLLRPETVGEIYTAARLAKEIGCRGMHIRPIAPSWDKAGKAVDVFNEKDIYGFREQLKKARWLENKDFGIYGITHKFNGDFTPSHGFDKCNAMYMTSVIMPPTDKYKGKLDTGSCCDNRGNDLLTRRNLTSVSQIKDYWGSKEHRSLIDKVDVGKCPRCLPSDGEIMTEEGLKKIKEVKIKDKVLTHSGRFKKVLDKRGRVFNGNLIRIRTIGNNIPIKVTPNHKIPVVNIKNCSIKCLDKRGVKCIRLCPYMKSYMKRTKGSSCCKEFYKNLKVVYKQAKDLIAKDDFLLIPKLMNRSSKKIDKELMWLGGLYLAEGTISKHTKRKSSYSVSFHLSQKENMLREKIAKIVKRIYGRDVWKPYLREGSMTIGFSGKEAYDFFKQFGSGAQNKSIPRWVFNCSLEEQKELIKGYFDGDGHYGRKTSASIQASSVSKNLLYQMRILLTGFGFISSVYKNKRKVGGVINGREIRYSNESYTLTLKDKSKNIYNFFGIKSKKNRYNISHPNSLIEFGNFWLARIKSLDKEKYAGDVWNLEVEQDHTYVTENVCVCNCTFSPHHKIYENAIEINNMTPDFI